MSNYAQSTFFTPKDSLLTGDPLKLIKGTEMDPELSAISTAIATKIDTAGTGMAKATTTLNLDFSGVSTETAIVDDDRIVFQDVSDADNIKAVTYANAVVALTTSLDHDSLTNYDANDHIDHTTVSVIAGEGLTGGGTIAASRTLDIDLTEFTVDTVVAAGDMIIINDGGNKKITRANFEASLLHDSLAGYAANDHVDHTTVDITAGVGLSGGGDISATRTIDLDVNGLTTETVVDTAADFIPYYDASAAAERKVTINSIVGDELGDGKWVLSAGQNMTAATEETIVYNLVHQDNLQRGSFSTSTGQYTAGANGARIFVVAQAYILAQNETSDAEIKIQREGSTVAVGLNTHGNSIAAASNTTVQAQAVITLAASEVVRVRFQNDSAETLNNGTAGTNINIIELA